MNSFNISMISRCTATSINTSNSKTNSSMLYRYMPRKRKKSIFSIVSFLLLNDKLGPTLGAMNEEAMNEVVNEPLHSNYYAEKQKRRIERSRSSWDERSLAFVCQQAFESSRICDPDHLLDKVFHRAGDGDSIDKGNGNDKDHIGLFKNDDDDMLEVHSSSSIENDNNTTDSSTSSNTALSAINIALDELEMNHRLRYNSGKFASCNTNDTVAKGKPLSMAIVLVDSFFLGHNHKIDEVASHLHYLWDHSHSTCNANDILLFLSVQNDIIHISTIDSLENIITKSRIRATLARTSYSLSKEEYGRAVIDTIEDVIRFVDEGAPERQNFILYAPPFYTILILGFLWLYYRTSGMNTYSPIPDIVREISERRFNVNADSLERFTSDSTDPEELEAKKTLMEKYGCSKCPICLTDFIPPPSFSSRTLKMGNQGGFDDVDASSYLGGLDKKPIKILRCGHPFCKDCWNKWLNGSAENAHKCPVCKKDSGLRPHQNGSNQQQDSHNFREGAHSRRTRWPRVRSLSPSSMTSEVSMSSSVETDHYFLVRPFREHEPHRNAFHANSPTLEERTPLFPHGPTVSTVYSPRPARTSAPTRSRRQHLLPRQDSFDDFARRQPLENSFSPEQLRQIHSAELGDVRAARRTVHYS